MGMAPAPADMTQEKARQAAAAEGRTLVTDTTPEWAQALRRALHGVWWDYHKRQLDLLQVTSDTDRRWEIARTQSLDLINEGYEVLNRAVFQILGQRVPTEGKPLNKAKAKE